MTNNIKPFFTRAALTLALAMLTAMAWAGNIADCELRGKMEGFEDGYGPYNSLTANVQVWYGDTQLEYNTDYDIDVEYVESYEVGQTYNATITGKGDWSGTKAFTFTFIIPHHNVIFVANGGTGTMADDIVGNDNPIYYLPECGFTAPEYKVFDHWKVSYENIEEDPIKQPGDYFTAPYIYQPSDIQTITVTAYWKDGISYLAADGSTQTCTDFTVLTDGSTSLTADWYVVGEDVTIADRISVSGTVNLILGNNATLTASKGITVGSDATLNIYAQTDDEATMGALVASGANDKPNWYAGIGGVENTAAGMITINGGQINATGWCAAGIGSGGGTSTVGTITINGGIVTAQDNAHYGAGIGGGFSGGKAGTINLNGGIINAAGIGSGYFGGDCSITVNISDGVKKIVATPVQGGACIGKGASASGTVTVNFISGGNIVTGDAKDAVFYDTGEGAQRQVRTKAMNHAVTMSDDLKANITATSEYAFTGETVTLTLGTAVDATTLSVNGGAVATTDAGNRQYTFTMPDEDVTVTATLLQTYAVSLPANMEVVSATNAADADGKYITGTTVTFKASFPYAASNVSDGTSTLEPDANGIYTVTVDDADITVTATVGRSTTIDLSDATVDFTAIEGDVLTGSTSHTVTIADGAGITLSGATISGGIVCNGSATITLVGTNSVTGATQKAGIQIGGSGTTLTIRGNGSLTANGGQHSAGIGLSRAWDVTEDVVGGNIVINGGTITANGGSGGAGIGAGVTKDKSNSSSRKAIVGNITITGGTVTAVGGSNADGIGAGQNNYHATIQIGTVTIYDGIEMVDASSIKDFASVVYMHGEDDVTASKTDYFTISENGDRRIIVPKDDNDYTITIADGIEHGTLTVAAATAKYMQTVTVTATPAFGYRFVRLIVKDAQNNDVASTGNSFFMPKGGATVSAVFEQGVHGTTEFTWGYFGPSGFVNEATIYDGVTTVNIQQTGQSYNIRKYNEYTNSKFRLDNSTYDADIPYTGGTGEFYGAGDGTSFSIPDNGKTGYYDIMLTDVGGGKWGVSILPTAAQMDVVPDQTYTGSAITPEPLVIAGSLSLTKGTDYTYSYENNTNVGTATVRATFQGDYASLGSVEKEFTIKPSTIMLNVTGGGTVTIGDKSASDGEAFGVMSEKGASVVLTLAPESGNTVRSVEYGYTNSSGTNRSGAKLPISDGTATLTVPNDLKDGTGVTLTVTFAAALVGGADEAGAVALTDAAVTDLAGGWYKVESDITFDHTLNLLADTYLTIGEGKTMTVSTATSRGIDSDYTLTVGGAGALSVTASGSYPIAVRVGSYVQTGATVTASGFIGIRCCDVFDADVTNDLTFSGGQLTVTGTSDGIWADNTITLGWTNATDRITASSYGGTVAIASGKMLADGSGNFYSSTDGNLTDLGGKTLRPAASATYLDADGNTADASAIVLDPNDASLPAGNYLATGTLNYTHGITLTGNATLILADNCHMNVGTSGERINDYGIFGFSSGNHNITITSQSLGDNMGALSVYTTGMNMYGILANALTINGGNITADTNGDYAVALYAGHDIVTINNGTVTANATGTDAHAIAATGDFNYNGGNVTATAPNGNAIYAAGGNYNFSWRTPADRITIGATGLYATATKTATFTRLFTDGSGNIYTGTLAATALSGFAAETTLQPCLALAMNASGIMTYAGTYALDFTGTLSDTDGAAVTPYIVSAFDGTAGTLTLSSVSTVPAQTGLLLKGTAGATFYVPLMTTAADPGQNYLHGVTDGTTVVTMTDGTNTNFILANGKYGIDWYTLSEAGSIGANKAYLSLPTADLHLSSGAARFTWVYDGETTGLTPLLSPEGDENGVSPRGGLEGVAYYTLDGRKLDGKPSKAGLYINNGKKVIIK